MKTEHTHAITCLGFPDPAGVSGWECKARGCPLPATHRIVWKTIKGASLSYRCRVHAREFAERHGLVYPETPAEARAGVSE